MVKFEEALRAIFEDYSKEFSRDKGMVVITWEDYALTFKDDEEVISSRQNVDNIDMRADWTEVNYCKECGHKI